MLEAKKELADLTVAQGEQWLTKLSTGELAYRRSSAGRSCVLSARMRSILTRAD